MNTIQQRIRGEISPAILDKVNRLFRNDDAGVWIELLQNARRAGASVVNIDILESDKDCEIVVTDSRRGSRSLGSGPPAFTVLSMPWAPKDLNGIGFMQIRWATPWRWNMCPSR